MSLRAVGGWPLRLAALIAAAALLVFSLLPASADADSSSARPTIVLVHGAWADSGSRDQVVAGLQRHGYSVVAFPNPLRGLPDDSAYLPSFLQTISGPVVLVGHSYGGSVITNAATQRPASTVIIGQPSGPPAWTEIPSWALVGTADRVAPPATQLFRPNAPMPASSGSRPRTCPWSPSPAR